MRRPESSQSCSRGGFVRAVTLRICLLSLTTGFCGSALAQFTAFSLNVAENEIRHSWGDPQEVATLSGINRVVGMVYDTEADDLIIIGEKTAGVDGIHIEDFVVALRALFLHEAWPLVSIDRVAETDRTGLQDVRFEGGIDHTRFGRQLLEADVVLKKLALGLLSAEVWGVQSYFERSIDVAEQQNLEGNVASRFWFHPDGKPKLAVRDGVFAIRELRVGVRTQMMSAAGNVADRGSGGRDEIGELFASELTASYEDLSLYFPEIARLKTLFDFVALARGIQLMPNSPDLSYWLHDFEVDATEVDSTYPLIQQQQILHGQSGEKTLTIDGGVKLEALILNLHDGDVTALRDVVLLARTAPNALSWSVPLRDWNLTGTATPTLEESDYSEQFGSSDSAPIGTYISRSINPPGIAPYHTMSDAFSPPPFRAPMPSVEVIDQLRPIRYGNDVGGVMLQGNARVEGDSTALNFASGTFSIIVDGEDTRMDPGLHRKFVTALWAVYFGDSPPGISIDPIAPGVEEHLVRYIGNVINSDLGRVMREADYTMKKWWIGTEKPDIPGFKSSDELSSSQGVMYLGASSRCWFVPEAMRYRQAGGALLFDSGRMTLKTQYVTPGTGMTADPADQLFADFFTKHYDEIAARYPVYQELFDYAKLVSLAQYLKQRGVPLYWYLMANRDLVLTEDSPGTVAELARGSSFFDGVEITGGVDLGTHEGQFVYDEQAMAAIAEAASQFAWGTPSTTSLTASPHSLVAAPEAFSFDLAEQYYTVLPQHSLTAGKDSRGIRYQTDLALRDGTAPGLEMVRYFDQSELEEGEFGQGWHLLVPYRIKPVEENTVHFANLVMPEQMVLTDLLSNTEEVLTFDDEQYAVPGYLPDSTSSSRVLGLFLMTDATLRLRDKLGNEFQFDDDGDLADTFVGDADPMSYEYNGDFITNLDQSAYHLEVISDERVDFMGLRLPGKLRINNLKDDTNAVMTFKSRWGVGAYVPLERKNTDYRMLVVAIDGSFRLFDERENEMAFDGSGSFVGIAPARSSKLIKAIEQGKYRLTFTYTLGRGNSIMISRADLTIKGTHDDVVHEIEYYYSEDGQLEKVLSRK